MRRDVATMHCVSGAAGLCRMLLRARVCCGSCWRGYKRVSPCRRAWPSAAGPDEDPAVLPAQGQALVVNAGAEIGVGFLLALGLLSPSRSLILTFIYWKNFLPVRYHTPDAASYHRQVCQASAPLLPDNGGACATERRTTCMQCQYRCARRLRVCRRCQHPEAVASMSCVGGMLHAIRA